MLSLLPVLKEELRGEACFVVFAYLVNHVSARKTRVKDLCLTHTELCHKMDYRMSMATFLL